MALCLFTPAPAAADDLEDLALEWGQMHGNAIYCNDRGAHDFGVRAIGYFKRKAGGAGRFNKLREKYGITFLNNSHKGPRGGCTRLFAKMKTARARMGR